jgi:hypothetical protein
MVLFRHAGLDPASRTSWRNWIPASAGMTKTGPRRLFTSSSSLNDPNGFVFEFGVWYFEFQTLFGSGYAGLKARDYDH